MDCELGVRKGQSEIMEYIFMVVLIVAAVIGLILFLSWWSISQMEMEGSKNKEDRTLSMAKNLMNDYALTSGDSMFDDAKLASLGAVSGCKEMQKIYGTGWYAKVKSLDMEGEEQCSWGEYPDCNSWTICGKDPGKKEVFIQKFPVNVYRKVSDKVALGILEVGVYT